MPSPFVSYNEKVESILFSSFGSVVHNTERPERISRVSKIPLRSVSKTLYKFETKIRNSSSSSTVISFASSQQPAISAKQSRNASREIVPFELLPASNTSLISLNVNLFNFETLRVSSNVIFEEPSSRTVVTATLES